MTDDDGKEKTQRAQVLEIYNIQLIQLMILNINKKKQLIGLLLVLI